VTDHPGPLHTVPDHDVRRIAVTESIRSGLWFIPLAIIFAATALAALLLAIDRRAGTPPLAFRGDASSAQSMLTTIASSTLTMTTLVVSITIVALQLASQQFSPRVMRTFFRDTGTKVALGIFLSTTVYALLVLRVIEPANGSDPEYVPTTSVTIAFGLMLASLATFLYFVNHVAHSIRAVHIMESVAAETRQAIRHQAAASAGLVPADPPDRPADLLITSEQPPGAFVSIDEDDLVALAVRARVRIRVLRHVGDYLPSGIPLAEVWADDGPGAAIDMIPSDVLAFVGLGRERTMRQDVAFGFRQLVDMADKALSPAVNDPTTAVQALDRIHDLLRRIAVLPDPVVVHRSPDGAVRLEVPTHRWDDLVHLAFDEIRQYGADSLPVHRLMRSMLTDLDAAVAERPERRVALDEQRRLLDRAALRSFVESEERLQAGVVWPGPDGEPSTGSGSGDPV